MNKNAIMDKETAMECGRVGDFIQTIDLCNTFDGIPMSQIGIIMQNKDGFYNTLMNDGDFSDGQWNDVSLSEYIKGWFDVWNGSDEIIMLVLNPDLE